MLSRDALIGSVGSFSMSMSTSPDLSAIWRDSRNPQKRKRVAGADVCAGEDILSCRNVLLINVLHVRTAQSIN